MKAEPDSRLENGVDVKFSIDDLAAATEPEAWDGVRNHVAKNNMMSMKKGDLAFFYHSNCKTPGIAGIMEIVEEAAPDESAFDSKHPYYDSKSSRDKPTWHCVKVAFRSKFQHPERLTLTALKPLAADDGPLANMQLFKQSRLSVSKVSRSEWDFITSHATGGTEDLAADEPILVEEDVPEAPNGAANAEAGLEHADQVEDEHAASDSSEPSQAQPDDDQLELTIGTPKGAAALLEASEEPEADTTIADATLVTAQEESSIVQENGVTTAMVTRETIVETSTVNDIEAAETGDDLPSEESDGEEDLSPSTDDAEGEAIPSKPADGAEQQTVSWESSPPAQAVRSPSLQPHVEDAGDGNDVVEATQPGEEQGEPAPSNTQAATDAIAPNVSSSFGTSSGGVPNDENAPPSSFENNDHGNHATTVSASAAADLPVDEDLDASAMDFEMTGAAGFDDAAQKQVLAELEPSSASVAAAQQQQGEQSTGLPRGFGFGIFGGSNGL
ncbi:PUA-like domain-containing protein [Phyllosticta citribraziliensis]